MDEITQNEEFFDFCTRSYHMRMWIRHRDHDGNLYAVLDENLLWVDTQVGMDGATYFANYYPESSIVTPKTLYAMWKKGLVS